MEKKPVSKDLKKKKQRERRNVAVNAYITASTPYITITEREGKKRIRNRSSTHINEVMKTSNDENQQHNTQRTADVSRITAHQ